MLNKEKIAKAIVIIGIISIIIVGTQIKSPREEFSQNNEFLIYLQQHEGAKDVRIFGDYGLQTLVWYGNYTVLDPTSLSLIVLNEGKPFYVNKSSEYYYSVFKKANIEQPNKSTNKWEKYGSIRLLLLM